MESILFSHGGIGNGNGYNESMLVGDDGYILFLDPRRMANFEQDRERKLTHKGAAEYYWEMFIERLRWCYFAIGWLGRKVR